VLRSTSATMLAYTLMVRDSIHCTERIFCGSVEPWESEACPNTATIPKAISKVVT